MENKKKTKEANTEGKKPGVDPILLLTVLVMIVLATFVVLPPVFRLTMPKPIPTPTPTPTPVPTPDNNLQTGSGTIVCTFNDGITGDQSIQTFVYQSGRLTAQEIQNIRLSNSSQTIDQLLASCNIGGKDVIDKTGIYLYCIATGERRVTQTISINYGEIILEEVEGVELVEFRGGEPIAEIVAKRELAGYVCEQ